ncbi:hypothetical protein [Desertimonas flava]|uniref:hypothetical protein n=1 Tax=Desertimonas flava TaxID=2064846 RepID=UPI000E34BFC3|nr:hypothetical protein [Desertimonas flava]
MTQLTCLSLWQPYATLLVLDNPATGDPFKEIETRPMPPWKTPGYRTFPGAAPKPGDWIGIHATARHARERELDQLNNAVGDLPIHFSTEDTRDGLMLAVRDDEVETAFEPGAWTSGNTHGYWAPYSALVGTARIVGAVPMVRPGQRSTPEHVSIAEDGDGVTLLRWKFDGVGQSADLVECEPIGHEYPFGWYEPGRWAWILEDAKSVLERCPRCMDSGRVPDDRPEAPRGLHGHLQAWMPCSVCEGAGRLARYPTVAGRQGWWRLDLDTLAVA